MAIRAINAPFSSNIEAISYDPDSQSLFITFRWQSATYVYRGVDEDTANGFSRALSASDYLKFAVMPVSTGERIG